MGYAACMEHLPTFSINLYTKLGTNATNQSIIGFQPSPLKHATRIKPSRLPPETRVQHQVIHHWCPLLLKNLHIPPGESPKFPPHSLHHSPAATVSEGGDKRRNVIRQFPDVGIGGTGQDWRVFTVTQGLESRSSK